MIWHRIDKLLFFRDGDRCMTKTIMSLSWVLVFVSTFMLFFLPWFHWTVVLSGHVKPEVLEALVYAMYGNSGLQTMVYKWGKSKSV